MVAIFLCVCALIATATSLQPQDYKVSLKERFNVDDDLYAGFMPIKLEPKVNHEGNFFFWLAKQRNLNQDQPGKRKLVVWLNGGPGCSSMVGMMWENGPFTIHDHPYNPSDYKLERNPYSWNEVADVVFVEQPIRTG
jgi:carboxypeptidase D